MPCMSETPEETLAKTSSEVVRLNQLLCEACTIIMRLGEGPNMGKDLKAWWSTHLALDKARRDREAREKAKKLNPATPERQMIWATLCTSSPEVRREVSRAIWGDMVDSWTIDGVNSHLDNNPDRVLDYLVCHLWDHFTLGGK